MRQARAQLAAHQPQQAQTLAERAIRQSPGRYEGHVVAATALRDQKHYGPATAHLQTALAMAPDQMKTDILRAIAEVRVAGLSPDGRRQMDALKLVVDDASKASGDQRIRLLHEFMIRSTTLLEKYPFMAEVWMLRAQVAVELDYPEVGWIAGRKLRELGVADSDDPTIRNLMAQLERKEWLGSGFTPPRQKEQEDVCGVKTSPTFYNFSAGIARAQAGDAYCANIIAPSYLYGGGTAPGAQAVDYPSALKFLTEAAEQGFATSANFLAGMYWDGKGVPKDTTQSFAWSRKAAELGQSNALLYVGNQYISGNDQIQVPADPAKAIRFYREAAAEGIPEGEYSLGWAYRYGKGVKQDDAEAMQWYQSAGSDALQVKDASEENALAWMFSTDPMPQFRDGAVAVLLAKAACDLTSNENWAYIDTLGAAYAEIGDWDNAAMTEQKAIDVAQKASDKPDPKDLQGALARLELYKNKQPYREQ